MKRRELLAAALAAPTAGQVAGQEAAVDAEPQLNDTDKFPKCGYCGMDRKRFHASRMLIRYAEGPADGTCSIRCAAASLAANLGRLPMAIWVGDNASAAEQKPLTDAETASYLMGSSLRGVMTRVSKVAYSKREAAEAAKAANGGEIVDFDAALKASYAEIADAVAMVRKTREERLKRLRERRHPQ